MPIYQTGWSLGGFQRRTLRVRYIRLHRTRVTANEVAYSKPGRILIYVGISMQGNKPPRPRAGSVCMQLHRELT